MARTTAQDVASFFVRHRHEHGDTITNLHLQKFLYYAQAWFLAIYEEKLFDDRIEAWIHGPVQPGQYGRFKHNGWSPIADNIESVHLGPQVAAHLEEVLDVYGDYSAWDLERMTHAESPWLEARNGLPDDVSSSEIIRPESMRRYFYGRLQAQQEGDRS